MTILAFDTETFRIGPGAVAPKLVCLAIAMADSAVLVGNGDSDIVDNMRSLFQPGHTLVGHNAAYDSAVVAINYPELEPLVWAKYAAGEIVCTKLNEQLMNLADHGKIHSVKMPDGTSSKLRYSLDVLENKYLGLDRSAQKVGEDNWRLNYDQLDGRKAVDYPADARQYAMDDAIGTLGVYMAQLAAAPDGVLATAPFQAWADFALFLITERGMAIDPAEVLKVQEKLAEDLTPAKLQPLVEAQILRQGESPRPHARQIGRATQLLGKDEAPEDWADYRVFLEAEGIKFTGGVKPSINTKMLAARIAGLCKRHDIPIKETPTGAVSTDVEVLQDLDGLDEVIDAYAERQAVQKLVTTELPRMYWEDELAPVVHFPFNALLETGRTSSSASKLYPSGNGQQLDPRIRPCYVAREGHVLLSTDYSTLELATVGQRMIDLFGHSVHADKINSGQDLHAFLAARLAFELNPEFRETCDEAALTTNDQLYDAFMQCKGHAELGSFFKWWRKFAKPVGLGFPGALGPWTFLGFAKKTYGVNIAEIAADMPDEQFSVSDYLLSLAQRHLGIVPAEFEWTGPTKALALAIKLKDIWLDTFAMRPYYEHIKEAHKDGRNTSLGTRDDGRNIPGYTYTSDFGMVRRGCTYTSCCNGFAMQTPAAEGAKLAVIQSVRACRDANIGSVLLGTAHPVDFIHDELLTEHEERDVDWLNEQAQEISHVMLDAMSYITPDVPGLSTEGVFMRRWNKFADPTFDDQGRLIVTEPAAASI